MNRSDHRLDPLKAQSWKMGAALKLTDHRSDHKASKLTKNGRSQIMQQIQINASMPLVCGATDTDHDSYPTDHSNFVHIYTQHRNTQPLNPAAPPIRHLLGHTVNKKHVHQRWASGPLSHCCSTSCTAQTNSEPFNYGLCGAAALHCVGLN